MKQQLLLLADVDGLGRSGDVVTAKPGFIRNFLLPKKMAVIADKQTLKMQARLKDEREKRAAVDRKEAEELAGKLAEVEIEIVVKNDVEGKMYGSVSPLEIAKLLQEKGHSIERKNISLGQPIKTLGKHTVDLKLKEGVPASFTLHVIPEVPVEKKKAKAEAQEETAEGEAEKAPAEEEKKTEE